MRHRTMTTILFLAFAIALPSAASAATTWKILCVGDSITHGAGGYDTYRRELQLKMKADGYAFDFIGRRSTPYTYNGRTTYAHTGWDLHHEGYGGRTTLELISRVDAKGTAIFSDYTKVLGPPDIVLLHIGTNDVYLSRNSGIDPYAKKPYKTAYTISNALANLNVLINERFRKKNPKVKILLAQIIGCKTSNYNEGIGCIGIKPYNQALVAFAKSQTRADSPVILVDQYTGYDANKMNFDVFHPNVVGEKEMAKRWYAKLKPLLGSAVRPATAALP